MAQKPIPMRVRVSAKERSFVKTICLPQVMADRIALFPSVNWSEIARQAFMEALERLEQPDSINKRFKTK